MSGVLHDLCNSVWSVCPQVSCLTANYSDGGLFGFTAVAPASQVEKVSFSSVGDHGSFIMRITIPNFFYQAAAVVFVNLIEEFQQWLGGSGSHLTSEANV